MRDFLRLSAGIAIVVLASAGTALAQEVDGPAETLATAPAAKAAGVVGGWAGEVSPNPADGSALTAHQKALVQEVSDYFAKLQGAKGDFVQISADKKRMSGEFFVKRPGRFRFNYSPPSRQVIVSDGVYLAIQDLDLNNEDRVALDQTPFHLLLRKDVDLLRDAKITEAHQDGDQIVIGIEDKDDASSGRIKLYFATKPTLELKQWVTTDAQGLDTRIELSELVKTDDIDGNLFKIQQLGARLGTPN
jgi:outer membrane lipoprotein-sorting protein